ncbi:MAG: dTDP-4-dehydrorhamnose 3,5-epimerase [Flavobacteriales bacterium]|jgi:dTDP-4-dehydrorhamnose 3,5-epimerase|nr:dTDP-4-dehydrorhamnose 3,5-epimerase [Flavobacteriales bacterium]|tara:strand:+ start:1018 stop:1572 length:555 start_codon:yes stop_codon:yes gene_type:complete
MKFIPTPIPDLFIVEPNVFGDDRGYFFESFNKDHFIRAGIDAHFIQDNESLSGKGVVRGLHFQSPPMAQGKLVRVQKGSVLDIAVDIRNGSPTYGEHYSIVLSGTNKIMLWIPAGFAHGFATLEDETVFLYKCTSTYSPEHEGNILWNDPDLGIDWGMSNPNLSEKDQTGPQLKDFNSPFTYEK